MTRWTNPRCGDCGLFTRWGCDWETAWGHSGQYEPDDPEAICDKCAQIRFDKYVAYFIDKGLTCNEHRPSWQAPACWYRARSVVRGMRKHGLVTLPVRHEQVRADYSYQRPDWEHKGGRLWCACGWNTGWATLRYDSDERADDRMRAHLKEHRELVAA